MTHLDSADGLPKLDPFDQRDGDFADVLLVRNIIDGLRRHCCEPEAAPSNGFMSLCNSGLSSYRTSADRD